MRTKPSAGPDEHFLPGNWAGRGSPLLRSYTGTVSPAQSTNTYLTGAVLLAQDHILMGFVRC